MICPALKCNSKIKVVGNIHNNWTDEQLKNEPMFFNCSIDFAYQHGGAITKEFIEALPLGWGDAVLDSRIHMLMPGMIPAIPGWHHDDVPRNPRLDNQPDYVNPVYKSRHIFCIVGMDQCKTEFALGECILPEIKFGIVYGQWSPYVENLVQEQKLKSFKPNMGDLVCFDWKSLHTARVSTGSGWRWFVRISKDTDRQKTITNEFRKQVQVYMEVLDKGW